MPEIGECYTIADKISEPGVVQKIVLSKKFHKYINKKKTIQEKDLILSKIEKPFAYGKSLWFPILTKNKKGYIVSQLGMSGSWFLNELGRNKNNDHITLYFKNFYLRYSDPRMFGKMNIYLYNINELNIFEKTLKHYNWGIDPHRVTHSVLVKQLSKWQKSSKNIKSLMMDQNIVFGIGNYLASEILYDAKINPKLLGKNLKIEDLIKLSKSIKKIVHLAIKTGGYSFAAGYFHPDGSVGSMARNIKVYNKDNQLCTNCKSDKIKNEIIGGRSTYYCKTCQK